MNIIRQEIFVLEERAEFHKEKHSPWALKLSEVNYRRYREYIVTEVSFSL